LRGDKIEIFHAAAQSILYDPTKTAGNSERTASGSLLFAASISRKSRISAAEEIALAVNFGKNSENRRASSFALLDAAPEIAGRFQLIILQSSSDPKLISTPVGFPF
jgi:hypothetical protein